jgi:16S rRNA (adenine(1408)-N(1))-methyltransferase
METIRGKMSLEIDFNGLSERLAGYDHILLDLGTGDGCFVLRTATRHPDWFVIGVDACRENLRKRSQAKLPNMLFVIASAQDLPCELTGRVSHVTINFPWGSLLDSLLTGDPVLIGGLASISNSITSVDVHLNSGALAEAGWTLETGADQIHDNMIRSGWQVNAPVMMNAGVLRSFPSTWAKRLAFGRDPRAVKLSGRLAGQAQCIERQTMPDQ